MNRPLDPTPTLRRPSRWLAAGLLLALGCAAPTGEEVGQSQDELLRLARPATVFRPTFRVPSSCTRERLVGITRYASSCPSASGSWRGGAALGGLRTRTGRPICSYEYTGSASSWSLSGLPYDQGSDDVLRRDPATWLEPDCNGVVPLADPSVEETLAAVTDAHEEAWRAHIGRIAQLPELSGFWGARALPVTTRVAVLDDLRGSVSGETDLPPSGIGHGRSVGLAIRDVLCPRGTDDVCPVDFKSYPVLFDDGTPGGSILALAERIREAARDGADVINLSVGFDRRFALYGDEETPAHTARATAVQVALNYAACQGAVVVAAAGNDAGGGEARSGADPMYPAAFARSRRWTCDGSRSYLSEPLAYLASAVGPEDEDVPNTRPGAVAELAAPGFAVTFADPQNADPAEHLPIRTGSSYGAAGVSAIAALVRAYGPGLSPAQTMQRVRQSAVPLGREADVCTVPSAYCEVRRVSACAALGDAIDTICRDWRYWYSCRAARAALADCDTLPAGAPAGPAVAKLDANGLATNVIPTAFSVVSAPSCALSAVHRNGEQSHYCPDESYPNGLNDPGALSSQPGDDPCRVCGVTLGSDDPEDWWVLIGLETSTIDTLSSPVLRVGDEAYALGDQTLDAASGGGVVAVPLTSFTYTPSSASLSFLSGTGHSLSSQLAIW